VVLSLVFYMKSKPFASGVTLLLAASLLIAQPPRRAFQTQSPSTISYGVKDQEETIEINNVAHQVSGTSIPGRPPAERLVLRKTTRSKQVLGDKGMDAKVTLEAWPLGSDLKQKPLYAISVEGVDVYTVNNALLVFARGVEEVNWWSVHTLGSGQHLFDTYVPLLEFSIARDIQTIRYVGLEAPPDDTRDPRLKEPHVVGVLSYASEQGVMREALLTCDNPQRAKELRSYWDQTRTVSLVESKPGTPPGAIRIWITSNDPGNAPASVEVVIPIAKDDLDLAHAKLPPGLHVAAWRR
jgi:hypothetical protein